MYKFSKILLSTYATALNIFSPTASNMQSIFARFFATNTGFSLILSRQ